MDQKNLRIKAFYGNNPNAVKTHVWIAISVYVLVAIVKRELRVDQPLSEIPQILSLTLFEKTPLSEALSIKTEQDLKSDCHTQLTLFDL